MYGIGIVAGKAVGFILTPVMTSVFTPADFGVLVMLQVFASVLSIFLNAGVQQAINRNYYDDNTAEHRAAVVGTGLLWRLILVLVIVGSMALAAQPVSSLVLGDSSRESVIYFLFTLANVTIMAPQGIAYTLYRVQMRAFRNTAYSVAGALMSVVTMIWLLLVMERGLRGALEATILANAFVTIAMAPDLIRSATLKLRKDVLRGILSYGLPLLPHQLAIYLLFGADRYFIAIWHTEADVGIYSHAYRVGMIMTIVLEGAGMAWTPFIFSIQQRDDARRIHALTARYLATIFIGTAAGLMVFGTELTKLLAFAAPEYWAAAPLVPWVVGGYVFLGAYQLFGSAVGIPKKTRLLAVYSSTGLVANLILNALLVPEHGAMGAAIATTVSYACMAATALAITQRVHAIPYEWNRFLILVAAGAAAVTCGLLVPEITLWARVLVKLACVALFPALLAALGFFSASERERMTAVKDQILAGIAGARKT